MKRILTTIAASIGICSASDLVTVSKPLLPYEPQGHPMGAPEAPRAQRGAGLHLAAAVADARFDRDLLPEQALITHELKAQGWRGECVNMGAVIWAEETSEQQVRVDGLELVGEDGAKLRAEVDFLRYTVGAPIEKGPDDQPRLGTGRLYADIIDSNTKRITIPAGTSRPLWIAVRVPQEARPGVYKGTLRVRAAGDKLAELPVSLTVQDGMVLPPPAEWGVHLDIWQHPQAIARWHDVAPWSAEHIALMRPYMQRLADAGQKVISCSIIDEAWNEQTYDTWPSMVEWIKGKDGEMRYDYTNFDRYVEFMMGLGISKQISCYTMLPWSLKVRYFDETSGEYRYLLLEPESPSFEDIWAPFLRDFREHLRQKGWLNITCLAIDERPDEYVRAALRVIHEHSPEFRVASAVNAPSELSPFLYDMSPVLPLADYSPELLKARKDAGYNSTFYVCMWPQKPNTYTSSPLAEAEWLGLFAAANNLDGFLRWAYNSWNRNPFEHANYVAWSPGDCWLVYPGNLSSVHFERLRDGMEEFEKIALLRKAAAKTGASAELRAAVQAMNEGLKELFTTKRSAGHEHAADILRARQLIEAAARACAEAR